MTVLLINNLYLSNILDKEPNERTSFSACPLCILALISIFFNDLLRNIWSGNIKGM